MLLLNLVIERWYSYVFIIEKPLEERRRWYDRLPASPKILLKLNVEVVEESNSSGVRKKEEEMIIKVKIPP